MRAVESALDNLDDIVSVNMISEIMDWAKSDPLVGRIADPSHTFLCGHSRVCSSHGSMQDLSDICCIYPACSHVGASCKHSSRAKQAIVHCLSAEHCVCMQSVSAD